jgi:hypothetical protein
MRSSQHAKLEAAREAGEAAERTWQQEDARQLAGAIGNQAFARAVATARAGTAMLPAAGPADAGLTSALARAADARRALARDPGDPPATATTDGGTGGQTPTVTTPEIDPGGAGQARSTGGGDAGGGGSGQVAPDGGAGQAQAVTPDGGATSAQPTGGSAPGSGGASRPTATGVSLGSSSQWNDGTTYGLITPIIVRGTNLADVLDSELVGASIDHTGSMASRPSARSNNSGFMPADSIPDDRHGSGVADHLSYFDNHGGDGSYARQQMDLFKIPSLGINTPQDMPNSGYRIKREVKRDGTSVKGIVTKTAEAVSIDGHTSTPGLTAKREATITLR